MIATFKTLARGGFVRNFAAAADKKKKAIIVKPRAAAVQRIKDLQRKFQVDDGVPVFLKGGIKDKVLYRVTSVAVLVNFLLGVEVLVRLIVPGLNPAQQPKEEEEVEEE